jgi:membrane protein YdbS with pleckstrin-like domain
MLSSWWNKKSEASKNDWKLGISIAILVVMIGLIIYFATSEKTGGIIAGLVITSLIGAVSLIVILRVGWKSFKDESNPNKMF